MAEDVLRYFKRNASERPWYGHVETVSVMDGVITIDTTLDLLGKRSEAMEICAYIQGSDVADFTPGHTVRASGGQTVVCPARTE